MRSAGVLMPITALPSPWGVGTMGQTAREFVRFLSDAAQTYWQVLPLSPTGYGDSPYQSFSSFAGNPYLIDLDELKAEGLLQSGEYEKLDWGDDPACVDYAVLYQQRFAVLKKAVDRLETCLPHQLDAFCAAEPWLDDYALFMALKDHFNGKPWSLWPEPLKMRHPQAIAAAKAQLADEVHFWQGVQFLFFRQWKELKAYANRLGIRIVGDLPIYVAEDSADVWVNPTQFQLDEGLNPIEVAGCPPDDFSQEGQLWGNPLFDWERMKQDGFAWWIRRIEYQFHLYDVLRIDHFRGFDAYYAVPAGAKDAKSGRWKPGPGIVFFRALEKALGRRSIIAEDLGFLTPSVHKLLQDTGYPGMKVLEFAFDGGGDSLYLPHNYPTNCIAYVGTHDNDTARGWLCTAPAEEAALAREYLHLDPKEGEQWGMMRAIWASVADCAIVQMQDLLGLGSEGRMNIPSTLGENWQWRACPGFASPQLAARLRRQMQLYGRFPASKDAIQKATEQEAFDAAADSAT